MFPLRVSRRSWSGDCGLAPVRGVDTEGIEDAALELRGPINELDEPSGLEAVAADLGQLGQRSPGGHHLIDEVGVPDVGGGQGLAHDRFDDGGDDAECDVGADRSSVRWCTGRSPKKSFITRKRRSTFCSIR